MGSSKNKTYLRWLKWAGAATAAGVGLCLALASGPERELHFDREVPTELSLETLNQSIWSVSNWPEWFFSLAKAERVDAAERAMPTTEQTLETGALVRLSIRPRKDRRGTFDLLFQITEFVPQKTVTMRLVRDGSGKIAQVVDRLEWKIDLLPGKIHATATARTRHWRSRLMSRLANRVLMNQLFYPDVMSLGRFTQPRPPNPFPAYGS